MSDSEDDVPQLSAETFNALQEFYMEENEKEMRLKSALENIDNTSLKFKENWVRNISKNAFDSNLLPYNYNNFTFSAIKSVLV